MEHDAGMELVIELDEETEQAVAQIIGGRTNEEFFHDAFAAYRKNHPLPETN